jgi:hypothetical protein
MSEGRWLVIRLRICSDLKKIACDLLAIPILLRIVN